MTDQRDEIEGDPLALQCVSIAIEIGEYLALVRLTEQPGEMVAQHRRGRIVRGVEREGTIADDDAGDPLHRLF
jgi:hypothetical protein